MPQKKQKKGDELGKCVTPDLISYRARIKPHDLPDPRYVHKNQRETKNGILGTSVYNSQTDTSKILSCIWKNFFFNVLQGFGGFVCLFVFLAQNPRKDAQPQSILKGLY